MHIAMLGTLGMPTRTVASASDPDTDAVIALDGSGAADFGVIPQEVGPRLVALGHRVTLYCRADRQDPAEEWHGMRLVTLRAFGPSPTAREAGWSRARSLGTFLQTARSAARLLRENTTDTAFVFGTANAIALPVLRSGRVPSGLYLDSQQTAAVPGKRLEPLAERVAVRFADALLSDDQEVAERFRAQFSALVEVVTMSGDSSAVPRSHRRLAELDLFPRGYHLAVSARPDEDHLPQIIEGFRRSGTHRPLVIVPRVSAVSPRTIEQLAGDDPRVLVLGGTADEELIAELTAHALSYLHGCAIGRADASLRHAMDGGAAVIAWDAGIGRRTDAGEACKCSGSADALARAIDLVDEEPHEAMALGTRLRARAQQRSRWDAIAEQYERIAFALLEGRSIREPRAHFDRRRWSPDAIAGS
ncbi:hypothetical protein [Ruicaihuangia caeni]|uniref:hypothetical protein n=1 Tax=Ruicaihuangia caeni TaxID=3042517 RepID=UPI00338D7E22